MDASASPRDEPLTTRDAFILPLSMDKFKIIYITFSHKSYIIVLINLQWSLVIRFVETLL